MIERHFFLKTMATVGAWFCLACFSLPFSVAMAENDGRQYLQIGAFRNYDNALQLESRVKAKGMPTVVLDSRASDNSLLYKVYIGPFESRRETENAKLKLRKAGIFLEDSFVVKASDIFSKVDAVAKTTLPAKKKAAAVPAAASASQQKKPSPEREIKPAAEPAQMSAPAAEKIRSAPPAPQAEKVAVSKKKPEKETVAPIIAKVEAIPSPWGKGRNIARGSFSVAYRHSYVNYSTEVTKRTAVTTSGGTVTSTPVSTAGFKDLDFSTTMQTDTVRLGFGLADFVEIYGDVGMAYRDFTNQKLVYGGGARINLISIDFDEKSSMYGAVQGDYLTGELDDEYETDGYRWKKEADWENIDVKMEVGLRKSNWRLYGGGAYGLYDESTKRTLLSTPPAPLTALSYQDDLEQEHYFGGFGGLDYYFTPSFKANFEGQAGNQNRVTGHFQYDF